MSPKGTGRAGVVERLADAFLRATARPFILATQHPMVLGALTHTRPDLALLRYRPDGYQDVLPGPEDVLLVVEVADSGAGEARGACLPLYARFGIPAAWLVDLPARSLELHSVPAEWGYAAVERHDARRLAWVALPWAPAVRVDLAGLL